MLSIVDRTELEPGSSILLHNKVESAAHFALVATWLPA